MKSILLTGFIMAQALLVPAQETGQIAGTVFDSAGGPLQAVTVMLLKADTAVLVKISQTDKEGKFRFDHINGGAYVVSVTAIGFSKYVSGRVELDSRRMVARVADIRLGREEAATLKEATVTAKRPLVEQKIDRAVFNIDQLLSAAGSNTLDILDELPGVDVNMNGQIQLLGKQGVIVFMDGRPTYLSGDQLATYLRSIPAGTIERVEIIPNPPAKYDASGTAGIINIVTRKVRDKGLNANVNVNYIQGVYVKQMNSINLTYHTDKIALSVMLASTYYNNYTNSQFSEYFLNPDGTVNSKLLSSSTNKASTTAGFGRMEFDYFIDKKTTLTFTGNAIFAKARLPTNSVSNVVDGKGNVDSTAVTIVAPHNHANDEGAHLNFDHQYKLPGKELTASLDYGGSNPYADQVFSIYNYLPDGTLEDQPSYLIDTTPIRMRVYSEQVDFTYPLTGNGAIQFGEKASYVTSDNKGLYYNDVNNAHLPDYTKTNAFLYKENVNAVYVSFNKDFSRLSIQSGLRAENTNVTGDQSGNPVVPDSISRQHYVSLFPTAYLLYKFDSNANNQVVLSYGRRIDRPLFLDLNPFPTYVDKYNYTQGNPYLQPAFANEVSLAHTYKQFLTTTLSFSYTKWISEQIYEQTDSLVVVQTVANIGSLTTYSISELASLHPTKWWNCTLSPQFIYNRYNGEASASNISNALGTLSVSANNEFQLAKGWSAELTGKYKTKTLDGTVETEPLWRVDGSIRKSILKGNGSLTLNFKDIFFSYQMNQRIIDLSSAYATTHVVYDTRTVGLTFSYRFGKRYMLKPKGMGTMDQEMRMAPRGAN